MNKDIKAILPTIDGKEIVEGESIFLDPNLIKKGITKVISKEEATHIANDGECHGIYITSSKNENENNE